MAHFIRRLFRNPAERVLAFLQSKHAGCFRVYNLCAEHTYAPARFGGRVVSIPCEDHQAPPLESLRRFCACACAFLAADARNVVAVHCKAGKGRTGVFICALLVHMETCPDVDAALALYTAKRMVGGPGVTIPSQIRFLRYYAGAVRTGLLRTGGALPRARPLTLAALELRGLGPHTACRVTLLQRPPAPPAGASPDGDLLPPPALEHEALEYRALPLACATAVADSGGRAAVPLQACAVQGDLKVEVEQEALGRRLPLFYAWVSTAFLGPGECVLPRCELDKVATAGGLATELRMCFSAA